MVEHVLGKNGVVGSSPILGSSKYAEVAEWSNAPVCKTGAFMASGVRIPPSAPAI